MLLNECSLTIRKSHILYILAFAQPSIMKSPILCIIVLIFTCATCKQKQKTVIDSRYMDFPDMTRLGVADSFKYLFPILDTVYKKDQLYRQALKMSLGNDNKKFAEEFYELRDTVKKWDRENLLVVEEILSKHGWLGLKEIGFKSSFTILMVLQHSDLKTQEKYLPLLQRAIKEKNIIPSHYAMFVDRINMRNKRPQEYGTQLLSTRPGTADLYPLLNVDSVDAWRKKIGMLETLSKYLKQFDITWDPETYKAQLPELIKKYKVQFEN